MRLNSIRSAISGSLRLTPRRTDALLGVAAGVAAATGLLSWAVGTGWARAVTAVHAVAGLSLLALVPAKLRGSVRAGFRRRRPSRWLSVLLGALVAAAIALGVLHATGAWHGVGYWSALWTHVLLAALLTPVLAWHVISRPGRVKRTDLDRRALLGGGAAAAAAAAAYTIQEVAVGGNRRFTGSHEIASGDPRGMPTVQWLNDKAPDASPDGWRLTVAGQSVSLDRLRRRARTVEADLDCTGGWWSRQAWDAVPLTELLADPGLVADPGALADDPGSLADPGLLDDPGSLADPGALDDPGARSLNVASATGYSRLFPARDAGNLFLAVGYGGVPLRRGHGAPVRLVAPGRRGFWWVKWVSRIELDRRPWWFQSPFPLE